MDFVYNKISEASWYPDNPLNYVGCFCLHYTNQCYQ